MMRPLNPFKTLVSHNFGRNLFIFLCLILVFADGSFGQDSRRLVKVLPVFFVPKGEAKPTAIEAQNLRRHLLWSQRRYKEMLNGKSTFEIEGDRPEVYLAQKPLGYYRRQPEGAAPAILAELLTWKKTDRFACNSIFLAVVMNAKDRFPTAGGRPINGGFNTGGGIVKVSSYGLNNSPNFQSTLQHELGHSFGLRHVDAYGYDMKNNRSIMAYNKRHHTRYFRPSQQPGELIPENYRGLALNSLVFKNFEFDERQHLPNRYEMGKLGGFQPMKIPGHSDGIKVTTDAGELNGSSVQNVIHNRIQKSINRGKIEYNKNTMWHSGKLKTGWATLTLEFPDEVRLDHVAVYSQHSGRIHPAVAAKLYAVSTNGKAKLLSEIPMRSQDGHLKFSSTPSKVWQLKLKAGKSQRVVVRGLRFFDDGQELFPPLIPLDAEE